MSQETLECPIHNYPLYYVRYETQENIKHQSTESLFVNDRPVFYCLKMHFYNFYWEEDKLVHLGEKNNIFREYIEYEGE